MLEPEVAQIGRLLGASHQAFEYSVIPVLSPLDSGMFSSRLAIRDFPNTQ